MRLETGIHLPAKLLPTLQVFRNYIGGPAASRFRHAYGEAGSRQLLLMFFISSKKTLIGRSAEPTTAALCKTKQGEQ